MKPMRIDVYQDVAGGWRWRLRAGNSRITAESGESYSSKSKVLDSLDRLLTAVDDGLVLDALDQALMRSGR